MKRKQTFGGIVLLVLMVGSCIYFMQSKNPERVSIVEEQIGNKEKVVQAQRLIKEEGNTITERFVVPSGYKRTVEGEQSFGMFLRNYPLKKYGSPILLFDETEKASQNNHEAIFAMKIGNRDLQQCADSVMRMYAEYLYATDQKEKIAFHFVDEFLCDYEHWKNGYRVHFDSRDNPYWERSAEMQDDTEVFEKYLNTVFAYSSTLSMSKEGNFIPLSEIRIGDVFLHAGSPGHVVMVVDTCKNMEGNVCFLLAQGFMPAQEFHILKNPDEESSPWYDISKIQGNLITPQYRFDTNELVHLRYLD